MAAVEEEDEDDDEGNAEEEEASAAASRVRPCGADGALATMTIGTLDDCH